MPPDEEREELELTDVVKSRILDRVLDDLANDARLGVRHSLYTKGESGVYGKYEKADPQAASMLEMVRSELEKMAAELETQRGEAAGGPSPPEDA